MHHSTLGLIVIKKKNALHEERRAIEGGHARGRESENRLRALVGVVCNLQGYLAYKKQPSPQEHHRVIGIVLL